MSKNGFKIHQHIAKIHHNDIKINKSDFEITLSFNDIKATLKIHYDSIISFADPSANFGLRLVDQKTQRKFNKSTKDKLTKNKKDNIINFSNYKKN